MAQTILTVCDVCEGDGTAATPLHVTWAGTAYVIDLCEEHGKRFAVLGEELALHGRRVNGSSAATSPPRDFACQEPGCGKGFTSARRAAEHQNRQHGSHYVNPATAAGSGDYTCEVCGKSFTKPQGLGVHRRRVHDLTNHYADAATA